MPIDPMTDDLWEIVDRKLRPGPLSAGIVIGAVVGILSIGTAWSWIGAKVHKLREAGWPNGVDADFVIAVATVATLLVTVLATRAGLRLTRESLKLAEKGLEETRMQRAEGFLPVLVVEGHIARTDLRANDLAMRWGRTFYERASVRVLNGGPGLAIHITANWFFGDLEAEGITIEGMPVRETLTSGAHHEIFFDIESKLIASHFDRHGGEDRPEPIWAGAIELVYRDLFRRIGVTRGYVRVLASSRSTVVIESDDMYIARPGDDYSIQG